MADGEALYERYKDALKRGHVASLRGRLDEALDAYAEASAIAPERPTPHTSGGTALLRRKRPAEALRYYEAALTVAPRDETALLGRAQALAALDRRGEAANAFDALAEHRAVGGRLADAVDAARRGLELAEGRDRRRTLERLIEGLRASEPGEPGRLALERALRVLEGTAMTPTKPAPVRRTAHGAEAKAPKAWPAAAVADIQPPTAPEGEPGPGAAREVAGVEAWPASDLALRRDGALVTDVTGADPPATWPAPMEAMPGDAGAAEAAGDPTIPPSAGGVAPEGGGQGSAAEGEAPDVGAVQGGDGAPASVGGGPDGDMSGEEAGAATGADAGIARAPGAEPAAPGAEFGSDASIASASPEPASVPAGQPEPASVPAGEPETKSEPEPESEPAGEPAPAPAGAEAPAEAEQAPAPVRPALDRDLLAGVTVGELARLAEAALDAGAPDTLERLLDLAAAHRDAGLPLAAMDACYLALSQRPDHVGLHLALVQLYDDSGWGSLAAEKLDLLERLAALAEDREGGVRIAAARSARA